MAHKAYTIGDSESDGKKCQDTWRSGRKWYGPVKCQMALHRV